MCISSFVGIRKLMREIKDDNWIDWLKDNEHSRKLFRKSKWNSKTAVIGAILLFIAIFYALLFICYQGYVYYANTIFPFYFPLSWYLIGVGVLAICTSCCIIAIIKKYRNSTNKFGYFLQFAFEAWFGILFSAGIIFFLVFFSNSYFGSSQSESQVAIIAEKKIKKYYHQPAAIEQYLLYLPQNKTYVKYYTFLYYNDEIGQKYQLYTHKGLFGWHVADSLKEIHEWG